MIRGGRVGEKGRGRGDSMWMSECESGGRRGCLQICDVKEQREKAGAWIDPAF